MLVLDKEKWIVPNCLKFLPYMYNSWLCQEVDTLIKALNQNNVARLSGPHYRVIFFFPIESGRSIKVYSKSSVTTGFAEFFLNDGTEKVICRSINRRMTNI